MSDLQTTDYPALYQSSDTLSLRAQRAFFCALRGHLFCLVTAALLSVLNRPSPPLALLQAVVLLGALACALYLFVVRPDRDWYAGRAVAESIKTSTWRFVSQAEPFHTNEDTDRLHFHKILHDIVEQNREVAQRLSTHLGGEQITDTMRAMRQASVSDRLQVYETSRIDDQQQWYAQKAAFNNTMATRFFVALIVTNAIAIVLAIARIAFPNTPYWPTDVFVTLAAGLLSWIQARRFSELAASYTLAAHEIGLIKAQAARVKTDDDLSKFVSDAENAFSREHTQWVARKDT